jgi:hypothetical protein
MSFSEGQNALLQNIQSRPELNGHLVTLVARIKDKARWQVKLINSSENPFSVKEINLQVCVR